MSDIQRPPWWLSDEDPDASASSGSPGSDRTEDGPSKPDRSGDWLSLLGSLGSLAGQWWTSSGGADHAHHTDPAEHPGCVICRAMAVLSVTMSEPSIDALPAIRWLPIRRL